MMGRSRHPSREAGNMFLVTADNSRRTRRCCAFFLRIGLFIVARSRLTIDDATEARMAEGLCPALQARFDQACGLPLRSDGDSLNETD